MSFDIGRGQQRAQHFWTTRGGIKVNKTLHPRQVVVTVTMSNGVKNSLVCTLHPGDYSFVDKVEIDHVEVGYQELPGEDLQRRKACVTQEVGHKVPASTIRKTDGRLVGSCECCFERVNIAAFPGTESVAEANHVLRSVLFGIDSVRDMGDWLAGLVRLQRQLRHDREAIEGAEADLRTVLRMVLRRAAVRGGLPAVEEGR